MQKASGQDTDGVTWSVVPLKLGTQGLDLRLPADPGTLSVLDNARFLDERTVERRPGHHGQLVRDGADYPTLRDSSGGATSGAMQPNGWVYGHGQLIDQSDANAVATSHYPIAGRARGIFRFGNSVVVWTGDRLLVRSE